MFNDHLVAETLFLLGQVFLGIALVWRIDDKLIFHDIRLVFLAIYSLYGLASPLGILLLGGAKPIGIEPAGPMFAMGMCGFNLAQAAWPGSLSRNKERFHPQ